MTASDTLTARPLPVGKFIDATFVTRSMKPSAVDYLAEAVAGLAVGRALCIVGDEASGAPDWLASRGWEVTEVVFTNQRFVLPIPPLADHSLVVRETTTTGAWAVEPGAFDFVAILYAHVDGQFLSSIVASARIALKPMGRLVVAGYDRDNLQWGVGGPQRIIGLYSQSDLFQHSQGMTVSRCSQLDYDTSKGTVIDALLIASIR